MADLAYDLNGGRRDPFENALTHCQGAAWIVDPPANKILAANPEGCARFGWSDTGRMPPLRIDAAMPGFVRLRRLLKTNDFAEPLIEDLGFWTVDGAHRLTCQITLVYGEDRPLLLVEEIADQRCAVKESKVPKAANNNAVAMPKFAKKKKKAKAKTSKAAKAANKKRDTSNAAKSKRMSAAKTKRDKNNKKSKAKKSTRGKTQTANRRKQKNTEAVAVSAHASANEPVNSDRPLLTLSPAPSAMPSPRSSAYTEQLGSNETQKQKKTRRAHREGTPSTSPRNDCETLEAIAAQIRSGQRNSLPATSNGRTSAETPTNARNERYNSNTGLSPARVQLQDVPRPVEAYDSAQAPALAKLAHEMKTTLSAIAAASEVMRDERLGTLSNERYKSYASDIHNHAQHVLGIIDRMLPSNQSAEAPELEFSQLDLNIVASSVASGLQTLADERGQTLELVQHPSLPLVIADETSLRQILINLVTNALKFTDPGGAITIETRLDVNRNAVIQVQDTGPGMEHAAIQRALIGMEPHRLSQRDGGGYGLGFPLVHQLTEANNATLSIKSRLGRGTTVAVAFTKTP